MVDTFLQTYLSDLVMRFGEIAVFTLIFLECAGLPLPGEITLVSAAIFAGTTHQLEITSVILSAAAGAAFGGIFGFWVGYRFGFTFLQRFGRYIHLTEPRLKIGQWLFRKYGGGIVFLGRFTVLLRAYAALLAGANRYPPHYFVVWNTVGGVAWSLIFGIGGFLFGDSVRLLTGPLGYALFAFTIIGFVVIWLAFKKHEGWLQEQAERALAEPG
jgi:membrane protein DedA with SNARE-associated domain